MWDRSCDCLLNKDHRVEQQRGLRLRNRIIVLMFLRLLPGSRSTSTGSAERRTPSSGSLTSCRCWRARWRRGGWGISSPTNSTWPDGIRAWYVCESGLALIRVWCEFSLQTQRCRPVSCNRPITRRSTLTRTKTWSLGSDRKPTTADPPGTRSLNKSAKRTPRKNKSSGLSRESGFRDALSSFGPDWDCVCHKILFTVNDDIVTCCTEWPC